MASPFGFLIGTVGTGLVGAGCDSGTSGTGEGAGAPFSGRVLTQDRNAFDASRLPAILTGHCGSLPLWNLTVIVSEEAKSSSQLSLSSAVTMARMMLLFVVATLD